MLLAASGSAAGIGCFFDDPMHQVFGLMLAYGRRVKARQRGMDLP